MIEVAHLTKEFGDFTAVRDVSFTVEAGECVGFLGPNGAGKTTTMRVIAGIFPPTSGTVRVAGHDVQRDPHAARRLVGYFPENAPYYPEMSVEEYLAFVSRAKHLPHGVRRGEIDRVVRACVLGEVRRRLVGKLSKGFRQRVGLAQALLGDPQVLILDEPTSGLDPEQVSEIRELVKSLRGQRTIVFSSHILSEVSQVAQRVVIINRGRVVAIDTPDNLTAKLRGSETMFLQVDAPGADPVAALTGIPGVTRVSSAGRRETVIDLEVESEQGRDIRRELAAAVVTQGWGLLELRPLRMSLEDIFLHLTTEDAAAVPAAAEPTHE